MVGELLCPFAVTWEAHGRDCMDPEGLLLQELTKHLVIFVGDGRTLSLASRITSLTVRCLIVSTGSKTIISQRNTCSVRALHCKPQPQIL